MAGNVKLARDGSLDLLVVEACCSRNWIKVPVLLSNGADPNARDRIGRTLLVICCEEGQLITASLLLESGADIEAKHNFGRTALHGAAEAGRTEVVHFLLDKGADVAAKDNMGRTILHRACYRGHRQVVTLLLSRGAPTQICDDSGSTCLHSAAEKGHVQVLNLLLDSGLSLESKDNYGRSPLHLACLFGHLEMASELCKLGSQIESRDIDGRTPLHVCCFKDHLDIAVHLLDCGADITATSNDGRSALHCASAKGHQETVFMLLDRGADFNMRDKNGLNPLLLACECGHLDAASALLDRGADIDAKDSDGKTALKRAMEKNLRRIASYLRDRGAQLDHEDQGKDAHFRQAHFSVDVDRASFLRTSMSGAVGIETLEIAFLSACHEGNKAAATVLIDDGADIQCYSEDGRTALHICSENGSIDIVTLLLDCGADIECKSADGRTALHFSCQSGQVEITELLITRGADLDSKTMSGKTALFICCDWGSAELEQSVAAATSAIRAIENCYNHHVELAALLLRNGANPRLKPSGFQSLEPCQITDSVGNTILHRALIQSEYLSSIDSDTLPTVVKALLNAFPGGSRIKNKAGLLPLNIALENDTSIEVIGPLIEATALRNSELPAIVRSASAGSSWCNVDCLQYLLFALKYQQKLSNIHLHLCGESLSGKTTAKIALMYALGSKTMFNGNSPTRERLENASWLGSLSPAKKVKPIDESISGRTVGLELNSLVHKRNCWLVHDYGGRKEFHVNHGSFLSRAGSVYVIVVSGWDHIGKCLVSFEKIAADYRYWLEFINSVAHPAGLAPCISLVNWTAEVEQVQRGRSVLIKRLLQRVQADWMWGFPLRNDYSFISESKTAQAPPSEFPPDGAQRTSAAVGGVQSDSPPQHTDVSTPNHQVEGDRDTSVTTGTVTLNPSIFENDATGFQTPTKEPAERVVEDDSTHQSPSHPRKVSDIPDEMRGFINRQSDFKKTWMVRYYVLRRGWLSYYDTNPESTSAKRLGSFFLQGYSIRMKSETKVNLFCPDKRSRSFNFDFSEHQERAAWLSSFREHLGYLKKSFRLRLTGEAVVINLSLTADVQRVVCKLLDDAVSSLNITPTAEARFVDIVRNDMRGQVIPPPSSRLSISGSFSSSSLATEDLSRQTLSSPVQGVKWPAVLRHKSLREDFVIPLLQNLHPTIKRIDSSVYDWLFSVVVERLVSSGDVVTATSEDCKNQWVVTDVNWLTRDILGKLTLNYPSSSKPCLLVSDVDSLTDRASSHFGGDVGIFPQLLSVIGVCIPAVESTSDSDQPDAVGDEELSQRMKVLSRKLWFPMFAQPNLESVPVETTYFPDNSPLQSNELKYNRVIIRRFELNNTSVQGSSFPFGYFPTLFSAVAVQESNCYSLSVYRDSLTILATYFTVGSIPNRIKISIVVNKNFQSFHVVVCTSSSLYPSSGNSHAWKRMQAICEIIRSTYHVAPVRDDKQGRLSTFSTRSRLSSTSFWCNSEDESDLEAIGAGFFGITPPELTVDRYGLSTSQSFMTSWLRNVAVNEWCVDPLEPRVEIRMADVVEALSGQDMVQRAGVMQCYCGVNERRMAVDEEGWLRGRQINSTRSHSRVTDPRQSVDDSAVAANVSTMLSLDSIAELLF